MLWRRAIGDMEDRFYCLANADVLDFSVSKQAVEMLSVVTRGLAGKTGEREFDLSYMTCFSLEGQVYGYESSVVSVTYQIMAW